MINTIKYISAFLFSFAFAINCTAQEFSFTLYVEDAVGNRDSVVLGYDATASDTADAQFSDVDISATPMDSVLELRIAQYHVPSSLPSPFLYQSKNATLKYGCNPATNPNDQRHVIFLLLRAKHQPITYSWDTNLFQGANNDCHRNSFIAVSSIYLSYVNLNTDPNQFHVILSDSSSHHINCADGYREYRTMVLNNGVTDTVYQMPFGFVDTIIYVGLNENAIAENINIFPNPAKEYTQVNMPEGAGDIQQLSIFDLRGQEIKLPYVLANGSATVQTEQLAAGFYFLRLQSDRKTYSIRFAKE